MSLIISKLILVILSMTTQERPGDMKCNGRDLIYNVGDKFSGSFRRHLLRVEHLTSDISHGIHLDF